MITLTVTAHCLACGWTAGPGIMTETDKAAEKHTRAGHPTGVVAAPQSARAGQVTR